MLRQSTLRLSQVMKFLFCYFLTMISLANGASHLHILHSQPPAASEETRVEISTMSFSWSIASGSGRRSVAEAPIYGPFDSLPLVKDPSVALAAQRTYRKDPLNGFKKYTGGWNISDHHYWASVSYTAVPLFTIAAVWFIGFGFCLLLICVCHFCLRDRSYGYSKTAYALSLAFLVLFTITAIIGCVLLYSGQLKFHESTTKALDYVIGEADSTVSQLRSISDYLASAKQTGVDQVFLPAAVQTDIDQIGGRLNSFATTISKKTTDNSDDIRDFLNSVRVALIVVSALMLALTFLGLLASILGMHILVYTLVILGWILVTATFILSGTFLLLHNATSDTCVAMAEWVQSPLAHTALDEILPCSDNATAQDTLTRSKEVTCQLVDLVNEVITNVSNINFAPNFVPMYYNQSGPLLPLLCNPFHHDLTDRVCSPGEVDLNNATQAWSNYVCQVNPNGICTTTGRLTPVLYGQMASEVNISKGLVNDAPFLTQLQDCSYARQTFTDITGEHCPALRRYSRWIYLGLMTASTAMMLSLVFWVIYVRERRHRTRPKEGELVDGYVSSDQRNRDGVRDMIVY
ncbi:PREDICTED: uncharacterized protein LOC104803645 [Tarenaya hassleriana]|uniref:uncharacterized protein LOC104803645 n=1 Tax=Tarenaya hassleriana TaxID=28532 RepID=UPI00053C9674|nr:PREDICTED: uncharacterized protein LOC104803645 [Tarenaya hassleriana]